MTIPAYRLPEHIERGSGFGPRWRNVIQESIAGNEQRFAQWTKCRGVGDLSWGLRDSSDKFGDFEIIYHMFITHRGSLYPFRFRNWSDYVATNEVFGTGDGTTTAFQLSKTYDPEAIIYGTEGAYFYVRDITLLASIPVIKKAGVVQTPTTHYTISSSGLVTFVSAPAADAQLSWSGEFDTPVRFDSDTLPVIMNEADIIAINSIPIKEVIGGIMKDFSPIGITSAAVGFPARICTITRRDGAVFRFAESDEPVVVDSDTYVVIPGLMISAIKHTSNGEMPSCEIVAVHSTLSVFDTGVIDAGLFDAAGVRIWLVDRRNLSRKGLLFTGSIGNITYTLENQVRFEVKGVGQFADVLMTQTRSPMCRTDLFSTLCGVNKDDYDVATTINQFVTAFSFTVTGALVQADGWFNQGVAVAESGVAVEIANWVQSSQTVTTYLPSNRLLAAGTNLVLYPGCDKTLGDGGCRKYSNQLNFQGEPHFTGTAAAAQQV